MEFEGANNAKRALVLTERAVYFCLKPNMNSWFYVIFRDYLGSV